MRRASQGSQGNQGNEAVPFRSEVQIFNACGIPVYVHLLLVVYFVFTLSNALAGQAPQQGQLPNYGQVGLIALSVALSFIVLFATVLIHELGHCAGAKIVGGKVHKILLWPLGGLAFCGSGGGPAQDLVVSLAGPFVHLPLYFLFAAALRVAENSSEDMGSFGPVLVGVLRSGMHIQIALAAFNLLVPAYPLDCSRILQSLCQLLGFSATVAASTICVLSAVVIVLMVCSMFSLVHLPVLGMGYSPLNLMLVLWLAYQTFQLFSHLKKSSLRQHPLFGDSCGERDETLPLGSRRGSQASQDAEGRAR